MFSFFCFNLKHIVQCPHWLRFPLSLALLLLLMLPQGWIFPEKRKLNLRHKGNPSLWNRMRNCSTWSLSSGNGGRMEKLFKRESTTLIVRANVWGCYHKLLEEPDEDSLAGKSFSVFSTSFHISLLTGILSIPSVSKRTCLFITTSRRLLTALRSVILQCC